MPNSLPEEQKQLLINILKNPANDELKLDYSIWLKEHDQEKQACFIERTLDKRTETEIQDYKKEKKALSTDVLRAIGLIYGDHSCGFTIKIDAEALLLNKDFFGLHFNGEGKESDGINGLCSRVRGAAGDKVLVSLAAGQIHDPLSGRDATHSEIVMQKLALEDAKAVYEGYLRAIEVVKAIHKKSFGGNSNQYDVSARFLHHMTGEYPKGYGELHQNNSPEDVGWVQNLGEGIEKSFRG